MKDEPKVKTTNVQWDDIVIPPENTQKCQHYFEFVEGQCKCRHCHMGLLGVVNIVDGRPQ